jgi:hypothetical protein
VAAGVGYNGRGWQVENVMIGMLLFAVACDGPGPGSSKGLGDGTDSGLNTGDDVPPSITFEPVSASQPSGEDVVLQATIADNDGGSGVFLGTLYYRNETDASTEWKTIGFVRQGEGDEFKATIKAAEQHSSGMWYYLLAVDVAQNEAVLPSGGPEAPYHFRYAD